MSSNELLGMSLTDAIRTRRSVSAFKDADVFPELVLELLETAVWTPNHHLTEPWRFIFLTGPGCEGYAAIRREMALDQMSALSEDERLKAGEGVYKKFRNVPAYVAVVMKEHSNLEVRDEDYAACCCLIQNFMLLAWERGLGSCWKTFKNDPRLRDYLQLAPDERVVGLVHLGYPADEAPTRRRAPVRERFVIFDGKA